MAQGWKLPWWMNKFYWYKWIWFGDFARLHHRLFDRYLRSYVRGTQMYLPLWVNFKLIEHLPKPPVIGPRDLK